MGKIYKLLVLICFVLIMRENACSTHLKAGEITFQRVGGLTYRVVLTIYTDSTSVDKLGVDEPTATLDFGDGFSETVNRDAPGKIYIGNATYKNVYTFPSHTYSGIGNYTISYRRDNRNAGVLNMDNSGNTPFYIQSSLQINPSLGLNNSPVLLYPPIDEGAVGQRFVHNAGAFDREGDSISYELTIPRQDRGVNVNGYGNPNVKPQAGGSFSLDPVTGDLVWDAPLVAGLYNVAFIIKEWRQGRVIGTIVRDMQIKIEDNPNRRPILQIAADTCIEAGSVLTKFISATDPDGHPINLIAEGAPFTITFPQATFTQSFPNPQASPASGNFNWVTSCALVRDEPYDVIFKAEDVPNIGEKLFDLQTWRIRILGPKPQGLAINSLTNGFLLNWNAYSCSGSSMMEIYRRSCDTSDFIPDPCADNFPGASGYVKIGEVPVGTTSYSDTVNIKAGESYCYIIRAMFALPSGGESFPSDQQCAVLEGQPVSTNVSVETTDSLNGKIRVSWTQPVNLDAAAFPGPYRYVVYRAEGLTGTVFVPIDTIYNLTDTITIDSTLNTIENAYSYKVEFYYNTNDLISSSSSSSSVFLEGNPGNNKAILNWEYNVAWNNNEKYHRIYYETSPGNFTLIDSAFASGNAGAFTATGLINGDSACFYIETVGEYCREDLPDSLLNRSQIVCVVPQDSTPPCPPILFGPTECIEEGINQLTVFWQPVITGTCNKNISGYNVYYSEHEDENMILLASNVPDTFFVDIDNFSLAGCYQVTALNVYGIEGPRSNKVCVDICVYYELPNLITPNRDNQNDVFKPYPVPKNVQQVKFTVFNRWGKQVYYSENDIYLNWPGIDSEGKNLSNGIYYFHAEVIYRRRLHKKDTVRDIKGWIHLIRDDREPLDQ